MEWYSLIFVAIVIEGIISYAKTLFVDKDFKWQILAAMGLGVLSAIAFGLDLFALAGINSQIPYFGMVLTGILLSRGSNYIFDIFKKIKGVKTDLAASLEIPEGNSTIENHEGAEVG